ncbi:hypothetical protein C479_09228 [Halovivax asiaticus JCM 14624]|uniref:Uncharacterized protein n=1 Tax=Halovivax asiaticus JCM 14624 TaxID=1227490 RepID=M0BJB3_9EURY|nr:hypothetical protein C479_09228 [Halovivax asiaticus JCM 14624]
MPSPDCDTGRPESSSCHGVVQPSSPLFRARTRKHAVHLGPARVLGVDLVVATAHSGRVAGVRHAGAAAVQPVTPSTGAFDCYFRYLVSHPRLDGVLDR